MVERKWDNSKRDSAQELVDVLLSNLSQAGGLPLGHEVTIAFRELSASSQPSQLNRATMHLALRAMHAEGQTSLDDFERHYEALRNKNHYAARKSQWTFLIPLELELENVEDTSISILGRAFHFRTRDAVRERLGKEAWQFIEHPNLATWHTKENIQIHSDVFVEVSELGSDQFSAWKRLTPSFDALRGLLEFTFGFLSSQFHFGGWSYRRKIPPPLWAQARLESGDTEIIQFLVDHGGAKRRFTLTEEGVELLRRNAGRLAKQPGSNSTLSLIADCLRLYSQAMDARHLRECFIGFWQLAEAITISEASHGKPDEVVNRICWHSRTLELKGTGYKATLMSLAKKRNEIVHRGIHDVDDEDVNILKFACDVALSWLFRVSSQLESKRHVEHFYGLRTQNDAEHSALLEVIKHIQNSRRK